MNNGLTRRITDRLRPFGDWCYWVEKHQGDPIEEYKVRTRLQN
jgi:hypothetical protein